MSPRRLLLAFTAASLAASPLFAQTAPGDVARRLLGPPQEFTAILAGKSPAPMAVPTYEASAAAARHVGAPVLPQVAPLSVPLTADLTRSAAAADQVSSVTVQAARPEDNLGGPAWWKVTKGDSTLWIMATPDIYPLQTTWDQRALQAHLAAARYLIVPGNIGANVQTTNKAMARPPLPKTNLETRLSPDLLGRLLKRIDLNDALGKNQVWRQSYAQTNVGGQLRIDTLSPLLAPNEYAPVSTVTERLVGPLTLPGYAGNPARATALSIATRRGLLIKTLPFSAAAFTSFRANLYVPEGHLQEACLGYILDILDADESPAALSQAVNAWAIGDVPHALKRFDPMNACPYGPSSADFWSRLVYENVVAVKNALEMQGEGVAIIEFDPLLTPGGVIDQLKAAGYKVVAPAGAA